MIKIIKMCELLIKKVENISITFWQVIFLIYATSFFRTFLESYANTASLDRLPGIIDTFFAIPAWFFAVFLSIFILLKLFTNEKIEKISRLIVVSSFAILIPPIVDIIANKGSQVPYVLFTGNFAELLRSFLTFGGGMANATTGATLGLKIEILIGIIAIGFYIFHKTKNWWRTILGAFAFYVIIFLFASSLSIVFEIKNFVTGNNQIINARSITNFYFLDEPVNSKTSYHKENYRTFIVEKNKSTTSKIDDIQNQYGFTLSILCLLVAIFMGGWWFHLYDKKKFIAMIKNFRPLRIAPYYFLISLGIYLGMSYSGRFPVGSMFDLISFVSLFLCFLFAGLFSVWENDEIDIEIDKISNPERPLAKGIFSIQEWHIMKYLFLLIALNFGFLLGLYQLIFILLFLTIYHLYSSPPLRLKKIPGVSSLLVSIGALITVWMGFFLSSGTESFSAFPPKYILGIIAIVFLGENVKNLKDIEGDKKNKINTLPVILGEETGKLVIGILAFLSTLLIPMIFFMNVFTFFTAIIFGTIFFYVINRKDFKEKNFLLAYFVFALFFIVEFFLLK